MRDGKTKEQDDEAEDGERKGAEKARGSSQRTLVGERVNRQEKVRNKGRAGVAEDGDRREGTVSTGTGKLSATEACQAEVALEATGQTKGPHTGLQDSS